MSFQISVNKLEGFEDLLSNAGCYLSVDGDFIDVITPITSNSSDYLSEISASGLLKLIIKNMRSGAMFGSVSINIENLKIGKYWLPLFDDTDDDYVFSVPFNVEPPKIESTVISEEAEACVKSVECEKNYEENTQTCHKQKIEADFMTKINSADEGKIESKIVKENEVFIETKNESENKPKNESENKPKIETETMLKIESENKSKIKSENKPKKDSENKSKIESENKSKIDSENDSSINSHSCLKNEKKLDSRFELLQEEYERALQRSEEREISNLQKIQKLTQNKIKLKIQINDLQATIDKKTVENTYLQERIKKLSIESFEAEYLQTKSENENLQRQFIFSKEQIKILQKEKDQSAELANSLTSIKINACHIHEEENQKLSNQISQLKQKILELSKTQEKKSSDKLEFELIRQIKDLDEKLEFSELSKQEFLSEINDLKQEIMIKEKIIIELKEHIEGSKTERLRDDRSKSPKSLRRKDSIDRSLEEYHAGQGVKNYFIKLARGLYEFGHRKVHVSMKNGTIICRVGGGYVQIDDFLNIYIASMSPKKTYQRNQSTSPMRNSRHSFAFLDSVSGKQTPTLTSVFDDESLLTYSCDSEDDKTRNKNKL